MFTISLNLLLYTITAAAFLLFLFRRFLFWFSFIPPASIPILLLGLHICFRWCVRRWLKNEVKIRILNSPHLHCISIAIIRPTPNIGFLNAKWRFLFSNSRLLPGNLIYILVLNMRFLVCFFVGDLELMLWEIGQ
ncbi:hypothetical protein LXL04_027037 [Taraxacum kok-saghyz]